MIEAETKLYLLNLIVQFASRNRSSAPNWEENRYLLGYDAALYDILAAIGADLSPQTRKQIEDEVKLKARERLAK